MRAQRWKIAAIVLVVVAGGTAHAWGDVAATVDLGAISGTTLAGEYSIGWRFFVDQQITITHLGLFDKDDNGLASGHIMGIWRVKKTGGLQLERQVSIGPGGTTEDHHVYVALSEPFTIIPDPVPYVVTDPVTHVQTEYYERWLVGVWSPAGNQDSLILQPPGAATLNIEQADIIRFENYTMKSSSTFAAPWGYTTSSDHFGVNFKYNVPGPTAVAVQIDIKPGTDPNPINQGANGVIPVAILTTPEFDAADVDPATVELNGATVAVRGKSEHLLARMEDVDGDGDEDLLCQVDTESWAELFEDGRVNLTGKTFDQVPIEGYDDVFIVPPAP